MKRALVTILGSLALGVGAMAQHTTNVCPDNSFAWGENIGWLNWRDANALNSGVRLHGSHLRGFIWGENVGWINVGNGGGPYPNTNGANFGVNVNTSTGEMSGMAWGENIGWINFGTTPFIGAQGARYDFSTRRFHGYAWGENVGWINLDHGTHFVKAVIGNINGDGTINFTDFSTVLGQFGMAGPDLQGDINGDGVVDFADFSLVLAGFGVGC